MEQIQALFLDALKAALKNEKVTWENGMEPGEWMALFNLAEAHHVLPMIYEAVYDCPAAQNIAPQFFSPYKRRTVQAVTLQTIKTSEFLKLMRKLREAGIKPLVVKGIICRNLYHQPDHRMSSDEDVLILPEQFPVCHKIMAEDGMYLLEPKQDIYNAYEVSYRKNNSPLYIELHKSLFSPESDAYGEFNQFFEGAFDRAVEENIQNDNVWTMGYTDHLFYLICHAFKHFLHSGFGIRQVCDIILFANRYGSEIDWKLVRRQCREIHAELFTAALFRIGQKYLTFDPEEVCWPEEWRSIQVDEILMLEDLLSGGIYGGAEMSRKHSSSMTLNAVAANKQGKKKGIPVLKTLFPSARNLEQNYPYLKKYPYLLPAAWIKRILRYGKELGEVSDNSASEAVWIGNQRIKLLKEYGIIK